MSSNFIDAGDIQRIERERNLVKTSPDEQPAANPFDLMLKVVLEGMMAALKRRLS